MNSGDVVSVLPAGFTEAAKNGDPHLPPPTEYSYAAAAFYKVGTLSARHSMFFLLLGVIVGAVCASGLGGAEMENDVIDLWVKQGGRLDDEMSFIDDHTKDDSGSATEMVIVLHENEGEDALTRDIMGEMLGLLKEITEIEVTKGGVTYTYWDVGTGSAGTSGYPWAQPVHLSPLDCFQEAQYDYRREFSDEVLATTLGSADLNGLLKGLLMMANPFQWNYLYPGNDFATMNSEFYVTTYDFCYWGQLVFMFNPSVNPSSFGWCRYFLWDPADDASPDHNDRNVWHAEIQNTFDETRLMLADFMLTYSNASSPYAQEDQCPLWTGTMCAITGFCQGWENVTNVDCPNRRAYLEAIGDEGVTALTDSWLTLLVAAAGGPAAYGLAAYPTSPDFEVRIVTDDSQIATQTTYAGVLSPYYCTLWDGSIYGQVIFPPITPRLMLGGVGDDFSAAALEWLMLTMREQDFVDKQEAVGNTISKGTAEAISNSFKRQFVDVAYDYATEHSTVLPMSSISFTDILKEASKASGPLLILGYLLLFVYAGFVFSDGILPWNPEKQKHSRAGVGLIGVALVALAIAAALGVTSWAGVKFSAPSVQVLPFLLLGLGVDDMFIVGHQFNPYNTDTIEHCTGHAMAVVGTSISTTSLANCIAFLLGRLTPLPVVINFSTQAAIAVIFLYLMVLFVYPAALAIDARRMRRGAWLPCLKGTGDENAHEVVREFEKDKGAVWSFLQKFYIPFLMSTIGKLVALVACAVLVIVACVNLGDLEDGLRTADVIPKDYREYDFMLARENYFPFWPFAIVVQAANYPYRQFELMSLRDAIVEMEMVPTNDLTWLDGFVDWGADDVSNIKCSSSHATTDGNCGPRFDCTSFNATSHFLRTCGGDEGEHNGNELCFTEEWTTGSRTDSPYDHADWQMFHPEDFYRCLDIWMTVDSQVTTYGGNLQHRKGDEVTDAEYLEMADWLGWDSSFNETAGETIADAEGYGTVYKATNPMEISVFSFYALDTINTDEHLLLLEDTREILDDFAHLVPAIPTGVTFIFFEQYLDLRETLVANILSALAGVFAVTTLMLVCTQKLSHHWLRALSIAAYGAFLNTCCCALIVLLVIGFMPIAGIKLNAIPAVSLIMCVGVAVEFTAHYLIAYLTHTGDNDSRMRGALRERFLAMVDGCLSTFLGVVMMAASEFYFIRLYFFVLYVLIIAFGLFVGLVFLPVLLSLPYVSPSPLFAKSAGVTAVTPAPEGGAAPTSAPAPAESATAP